MVVCLGSSGVISAVWGRAGGSFCGPDGTVTKEWSWLSRSSYKERVLIQVRVESINLCSFPLIDLLKLQQEDLFTTANHVELTNYQRPI